MATKWDLALGTDRDSTPPKVLSPCEAGVPHLTSPSSMHLDSRAHGPCAPLGTWGTSISVGRYRGRPTIIPFHSPSLHLIICRPLSTTRSPTISWPLRGTSRLVQALYQAI